MSFRELAEQLLTLMFEQARVSGGASLVPLDDLAVSLGEYDWETVRKVAIWLESWNYVETEMRPGATAAKITRIGERVVRERLAAPPRPPAAAPQPHAGM